MSKNSEAVRRWEQAQKEAGLRKLIVWVPDNPKDVKIIKDLAMALSGTLKAKE